MFNGRCSSDFRQAQETVDLVAHVAEAAGLTAVAVDSERFAAQSLLHEIRNNASIVELHAGAVGVEDADDAGIDFVVSGDKPSSRLGEALGLVVYGARADGIHVAPVGFFLWMLQRIAIALGSRRNQILRAISVQRRA